MDFFDILLAKKLSGGSGGDSTGIIVTEEILPNGGIVKHIEGQVISGTKQISSNGEFDVAAYKSVNVNVSGGGGGSTDFSPKLSVTVIPSNDSAFALDGVVIHGDEILGIKNGHIYNSSGDSFMEHFVKTVEVGESETVTIYPTLGDNALEIDLYEFVACTDRSIRISSVTASNKVNCEYDLGGAIYIEDPTKDASITVEVTFAGDN